MKKLLTVRSLWILWMAALVAWIVLVIQPESYRMTRLAGVILVAVVWLGWIALTWKRRALRFTLITVTGVSTVFLLLPDRRIDTQTLRADYLAALRRYEGVTYHWGGENRGGIDCSGLIRRGMIDAMVKRGLLTLDGGLVRRAIVFWWYDCTAKSLGQHYNGLTVYVLDTPSLNALDHSQVLPGDLSVTQNGVHIMAYLGENVWIEADPGARKVIAVKAPSEDNEWFHGPMKIVRWNWLQ